MEVEGDRQIILSLANNFLYPFQLKAVLGNTCHKGCKVYFSHTETQGTQRLKDFFL
jgi:hypothetical protein